MIPLSAPLPLRQNTVWGSFKTAAPIPHRYGECAGELLQYDDQRTLFVWADHPCEGVDAVTVGGLPVQAWQTYTDLDSTGHAVTFVEFSQPQDEGAEIIASGRGKLHPRTGQRMTNPADIVWDILANIAGNGTAENALAAFRLAAERAGITVAGSLDSGTVQAAVRDICDSVGALFCANMPGLCRFWPGPQGVATAKVDFRDTLSAQCDIATICNDLTVNFAFEGSEAKQAVQVAAPASIATVGRRAETLDAKWVTSPRVAFDVARRILEHRARRTWEVTVSDSKKAVRVGDVVSISHPALLVTGSHMALSRVYDLDGGRTEFTLSIPIGAIPRVDLIRQSSAFEPQQYAGVGLQRVGDDYLLVLQEESGAPIQNAQVTLDNTVVRYSDAAGRVKFPASLMPPGEHRLAILTGDGRTLTTIVTVQ